MPRSAPEGTFTPLEIAYSEFLRDALGLMKGQQEIIETLIRLADVGGTLDRHVRAAVFSTGERTRDIAARIEEVLP
jgi:hypothetical protein